MVIIIPKIDKQNSQGLKMRVSEEQMKKRMNALLMSPELHINFSHKY